MKFILQMFIDENFGDDLFLDILVNRYPNIKFTIFVVNNPLLSKKYKKRYNNIDVISVKKIYYLINSLLKILFRKDFLLEKKLKKSDGLIMLGGSIFMDSPKFIQSFKANILADVRLHALRIGKPTFVIGSNFGPLYHNRFIYKYKNFFKKCTSVCFRDSKSKSYFKNLDNVISAPDVVFNRKKTNYKIENNTVGISVIDLSDSSHSNIACYQEKYEDKMIEIINELLKRDYAINLYSFCNNQGDNKAISRIINRIEIRNKVNCYEYKNLDLDGLIKNFASNEYIISTRFHAMILGLINEQKVFPIVYDVKTKNVIDDFKLKNFCCLEKIDELNIYNILSTNKYRNIEKIQHKANKQFAPLENFINLYKENINEYEN